MIVNVKLSVVIILVVIFSFFFLYYLPFCTDVKSGFSDVLGYYSVLRSGTNFVFGFLGIALGAFYYFDRERRSKEERSSTQRVATVNVILDEINQFDDTMLGILTMRFKDEDDLNYNRRAIDRRFDIVQTMIDSCWDQVGFTVEDAQAIVAVNSFVEKNDTIMRSPYRDIDRAELARIEPEYTDLLKSAKRILVKYAR